MNFGPALQILTQKAWALEPGVLNAMARIFIRHAQGDRLAPEEVEAAVKTERNRRGRAEVVEQSPGYSIRGGVAIVPIYGVIAKRADMVNGTSQPRGTSTEAIRRDLAAAVNDPDVHAILLDVDSPGGTVDGVAEAADDIFNARQKKLIVAYADGCMCSAAYFMGSQAAEVYAGKTSVVGSIGVYSVWYDASKMYQDAGVQVTVVRSGALKGAGTEGAPITDEQFQKFQRTVDAFASVFRTAVAVGRDMTEEEVAAIADGDVHVGAQATDVNLIDGVSTFEAVLADLQNRRFSAGSAAAKAGSAPQTGETETSETGVEKTMAEETTKTPTEGERLQALKAAFPEQAAFVLEQFEAGHDVTTAKAEMADRLAEENAKLKADLAKEKDAAESAKIGNAALTSGEDTATDGDDGAASEKYEALIAEKVKAGGTRYDAVATIARKHPHLHEAVLRQANSGRDTEQIDRLFKR